jgi:hypothetical protein
MDDLQKLAHMEELGERRHGRTTPYLFSEGLSQQVHEMNSRIIRMEGEFVEEQLREHYAAAGSPYGTTTEDGVRWYQDHMDEWRCVHDGAHDLFRLQLQATLRRQVAEVTERARRSLLPDITSLAEDLDRAKPPFVPDDEGDAPGPWFFTTGWVQRAYKIQQRNGWLKSQRRALGDDMGE